MELRRLAVRNVRSFESAELVFGPGTTLLVGDVGAGKTSLLYAVEMALFGFAEVDATYLIRHGADEAEVSLELADAEHVYRFARRFRRKTSRGRETFELESSTFSEDGARRSFSATELRRRTIELLGFPDNPNPRAHSDLWRWAVYVPQERMRAILDQEPSERLETVRKALGVEQYRRAAENAQLVGRELDRRARQFEAEALGHAGGPSALAAANAEIDSAAAELSALHAAESVAADHRAGLDVEWSAAEASRAAREAARAEADRLGERVTTLATQIARDESHAGELVRRRDEAEGAASDADRLTEELRAVAAERADVDARLAGIDTALDELRRASATHAAAVAREAAAVRTAALDRVDLDRARSERETTEAELAAAPGPVREPPAPTPRDLGEIARDLEASQEAVGEAQAAFARADATLREIDRLLAEGECPRCHQRVDPATFGPHQAEAGAARAAAEQELESRTSRRRSIDEERRARERFERAHEAWSHAAERRRLLSARVDAAGERLDRAREKLAASETERAAAHASVEAAGPLPERLAALEGDRSAVEAARTRVGRREVDLTGRLEAARARAAEAARLEADLGRVETLLAESRAAWAETERSRAEAEARAREPPEARADRERLEAARRAADAAALERRQRIGAASTVLARARDAADRARDEVATLERLKGRAGRERAVGRWLGHPFRDALFALEQRMLARARAEFEGEFVREFRTLVDDPSLLARVDATFAPVVEIDGAWTPPEALSGGERTALALAYRLALGRVVRSFGELTLDTILLDEPTDGFSPEQVIRMGEVLDGLGLAQIVLVSHEAGLAGVADRVVRIRKTGGRSALEGETGAGPTAAAERPAAGSDTGGPAAGAAGPPRKRRRVARRLDEIPPAAPTP